MPPPPPLLRLKSSSSLAVVEYVRLRISDRGLLLEDCGRSCWVCGRVDAFCLRVPNLMTCLRLGLDLVRVRSGGARLLLLLEADVLEISVNSGRRASFPASTARTMLRDGLRGALSFWTVGSSATTLLVRNGLLERNGLRLGENILLRPLLEVP